MPKTIPYPVGWPVLYKGTEPAAIEAVHYDADLYYTIKFIIDNREVQTVSKHLSSWIDDKDAEYKLRMFKEFSHGK